MRTLFIFVRIVKNYEKKIATGTIIISFMLIIVLLTSCIPKVGPVKLVRHSINKKERNDDSNTSHSSIIL